MPLDSLSRILRRRKYNPIPHQASSLSPSQSPFHFAASPAASSPPRRTPGRHWRLCFRPRIRVRLSSLRSRCAGEVELVLGSRTNAASRRGGVARAQPEVVDEIVPEGPLSELNEEELQRRECIDLLRRLAASGSVRGLVY